MNTAIVYRSMTGHSKKIARAVSAVFNVQPKNIKKKPLLENIDLLFIIGGIYSWNSLPNMLAYTKTLNKTNIKKAALITSSMMNKTGQDEVRRIVDNGIEVVDEYRCCGNFLFLKMGHPNKKEIQGAIEFAKGFSNNDKAI